MPNSEWRDFCTKTQHKSAKAARRHMKSLLSRRGHQRNKQDKGKVSVYQCDICGFWHWGGSGSHASRSH